MLIDLVCNRWIICRKNWVILAEIWNREKELNGNVKNGK